MKQLLLIFLLLPSGLFASTADSLFQKGNEYYMQREYSQAEQCYMKIIRLGFESADLYFNLANSLYKQGEIASSILYYEKALLLKPGDPDIKANLALANTRIIDKIDVIPPFFVRRWINWLRGIFSPDTWAVLSIVLFVLGLIGFFTYQAGRERTVRRVSFYAGIFFLVFSFISLALMVARIKGIVDPGHAIIMSPSVTARSSPDEQSTTVFVLHEGTKVTITDSIQNWKEIRIPDGNKGWIPGSAMTEI